MLRRHLADLWVCATTVQGMYATDSADGVTACGWIEAIAVAGTRLA